MESNIRANKGKSIIGLPSQYVCIDIETTGLNPGYDYIIEVAAARVVDGQIVDSYTSLVKPHGSAAVFSYSVMQSLGYENFSDVPEEVYNKFFETHLVPEFITEMTGITNEMLQSAPPTKEVIPDLLKFIGDSILVGYNVNFDVNFLYDEAEYLGLTFANDFIDTLRMARKLYPQMEHHRLVDMVEKLEIDVSRMHRAMADTAATIECYEKLKDIALNQGTEADFVKRFSKNSGRNYVNRLSSIVPSVDSFDDTNPLFGKTVVFTGPLSRMGRQAAFQLVANLGGAPLDSITKKVNFLVVGNGEFAASVKNGKTSKMKKAEELRVKGFDIETLSEDTFFSMINDYIHWE